MNLLIKNIAMITALGFCLPAPPVVLSLAIRLLTQLAQEFLAVQSHFTVSLLSVVLCY